MAASMGRSDSCYALCTASQSAWDTLGKAFPFCPASETLSGGKIRDFFLLEILTMYNESCYTDAAYVQHDKEATHMAYKQISVRETRDTINTGFRIPKPLYRRFEQYKAESGWTKTDIMIAALNAYLPDYDEEGGREE